MSRLDRVIYDPDNTPPSVPQNLTATANGETRIDLAWNASTDTGGSGLAGYDVLKDSVTVIPLGIQTSYSDTGLAVSSSHSYRVRARDGNNNTSAYGSTASATTAGSSSFIAQPGFSVTGTFAEGGVITITKTGGGFGTKPNDPRPLLWMPFDSSVTPSSLGRVTSDRPLGSSSGGSFAYSTSGGANGQGCLVYTSTGFADGSSQSSNNITMRLDSDSWAGSTYDWNSYDQKVFIHRKAKKTFGHLLFANGKNVKNFRMWGRTAANSIQRPNVYFSIANGGKMGLEGLQFSQAGGTPYIDYVLDTDHPGALAAADGITNTWYQEEFLLKTNSAANNPGSTPDADFRWAVNGGNYLVGPWPESTWGTWYMSWRNASGDDNDGRIRIMFPLHYEVEGSDGWIPLTAGHQYSSDDVYVDDSWCRVPAGDSATYNSCTSREPQIPSAWSDSSVTVTLNKGAFSSLSGKHLFVVTNNDTKYYIGQFS